MVRTSTVLQPLVFNVAGYVSAVSQATDQMQGIWLSDAATAFKESFDNFNGAMSRLSQILQDISVDFSKIKTQIEDLVNNNVLTQVETYAGYCLTDSENLTKYADEQDRINQEFSNAYKVSQWSGCD